ncbi:hypothetical protein ADUPG1_001915, partial [Aduncisulcus paluster]
MSIRRTLRKRSSHDESSSHDEKMKKKKGKKESKNSWASLRSKNSAKVNSFYVKFNYYSSIDAHLFVVKPTLKNFSKYILTKHGLISNDKPISDGSILKMYRKGSSGARTSLSVVQDYNKQAAALKKAGVHVSSQK